MRDLILDPVREVTPLHGQPVNRWPFRALLLLLVLAPLPLGSNRTWALMLLGMGVVLALVWAWGELLRRGQSPIAYVWPARWPLTALVAYALLVLAQFLFAGRPADAALWWVSSDTHQTRVYLLATLSYLGMFLLVLLTVVDTRRLRLLVWVLVGSGVLQALLAVLLLSARARYQFMWFDVQHGAQAIGSFVNRNHLAGYLYLCLSAGIGLLLGSLRPRRVNEAPSALRHKLTGVIAFVMSPRMVLRLLLVVMVIALVLTRSRMGNTAFFLSLLVLAAVVAAAMPALRRKALLLVVSLLIVDMVVIGQWVGLERLMQRLEGTSLQEEDRRSEESVEARLEPALRSLPLIAQRPWFGHGGGTYYSSFSSYKTRDMRLYDLYFDHAHNDYAEVAADTGVVGLLLLVLVPLLSLWRVSTLLRHARDPVVRGVAFAGLSATVCLGLHSMVDFNLQIPANAITFVAMLAMVWSCPIKTTRHPQS